jgi:hypothetical protein
MADNFSLYEFTRSMSLTGWIALILVMMGVIYVIAKGTELLVTKRCPFCEKRIPKRASQCSFCKKAVG